jgi:hypothetical protein
VRVPEALADQPVLSHAIAETHETAMSWLPVEPAGLGVD